MPHRKIIRQWLTPLSERSTLRAFVLLLVDTALFIGLVAGTVAVTTGARVVTVVVLTGPGVVVVVAPPKKVPGGLCTTVHAWVTVDSP